MGIGKVDVTTKNASKVTKSLQSGKRKANNVSDDRGGKRHARDTSKNTRETFAKPIDLTASGDDDTEITPKSVKKKSKQYGEDGERRLRK
jgi:hypothetical protein